MDLRTEYNSWWADLRDRLRILPPATILALWTLLFDPIPAVGAAEKIYSIASLNAADQFIAALDGFRIRMAELGYREGYNVGYQYYNSRGNAELLRTLARKVARDKVDMIVTSSTNGSVAAAKAIGLTIPKAMLLRADVVFE